MPSAFLVQLDTTAPPLAIEVEQGPEPSLLVVKLLTDVDAFEARLWGTIDPTDPITNANYGEGSAEYFPLESNELLVRVAPGDTTLNVQVRDDVWNESAVEVFTTEVPVEPTTPPNGGFPAPPKPKRKQRRVVFSSTQVGIRSSETIEREVVHTVEQRSEIIIRSRGEFTGRAELVSRTPVGVLSEATAEGLATSVTPFEIGSQEVIERRGSSDEEALLALIL